MKKCLQKWTIGVCAGFLAFGGLVESATALDIVLAISAKPGSTQYVTAEEFTSRANELLGDKAKVIFYGSAQLGKDKDLMQKLKLGTVHLTMPSSVMSSIAPEAGLFDMPFLVKDRAHLNRIEHKIFWPQIAPAIEAKGYKVIGFWENGIRHTLSKTFCWCSVL